MDICWLSLVSLRCRLLLAALMSLLCHLLLSLMRLRCRLLLLLLAVAMAAVAVAMAAVAVQTHDVFLAARDQLVGQVRPAHCLSALLRLSALRCPSAF